MAKDYYLLFVWKSVEPDLLGPFSTIEDRDKKAKELRKSKGDEHDYFTLDVDKGTEINVGCYSGSFFEE